MFNTRLNGAPEVNMTRIILRLPAVIKRVGLSRSTIYRLISTNEFPSPRPIGARAVGWLECDVSEWVDNKFVRGPEAEAPKARADNLFPQEV